MNVPGPLSIVKLICVASGAGTNPVPVLTLTCAMKVWFRPTGSVPPGAIWMFASTTCNGSHAPSEGA